MRGWAPARGGPWAARLHRADTWCLGHPASVGVPPAPPCRRPALCTLTLRPAPQPENVLLGEGGLLKLADFGIAQARGCRLHGGREVEGARVQAGAGRAPGACRLCLRGLLAAVWSTAAALVLASRHCPLPRQLLGRVFATAPLPTRPLPAHSAAHASPARRALPQVPGHAFTRGAAAL